MVTRSNKPSGVFIVLRPNSRTRRARFVADVFPVDRHAEIEPPLRNCQAVFEPLLEPLAAQ